MLKVTRRTREVDIILKQQIAEDIARLGDTLAEETTRELADILTRREQLAAAGAEPLHRFATTSDNIAEFAVAGSFIFGQPLKSVEHVDLEELR